MKRLRLRQVPGDKVKPGETYLMMASPQPIPLQPGEVPEIGSPLKIQMVMSPCLLEWVDTAEDGTETAHPVVLEDNTPRIELVK